MTSETSDGLMSGLVCLPAVHWPAMRLARIGFLLGYHGTRGRVESSEGILRFRRAACCRRSCSPDLSDAADRIDRAFLGRRTHGHHRPHHGRAHGKVARSEEHTSELQSRFDLVCRLLLEKKK